MVIKVDLTFKSWPYEESLSVNIPPDDFSDLDKIIDALTSNLKMRIMTHVRTHHPDIWYKNTPFNAETINNLLLPIND